MYYLNSRYYNPEIGRFINADGQIGQPGYIIGHNLYAYNQNNPVTVVINGSFNSSAISKKTANSNNISFTDVNFNNDR